MSMLSHATRRRLLPFAFVALAATSAAATIGTGAELRADEVVRETAQEVIRACATHMDDYAEDPRPFRAELARLLGSEVAYDAVARGVMGAHAAEATPDQRARFARVFEDSLVALYAGLLMSLEADAVAVREAVPEGENRARVNMEVTARDGEAYDVFYTMVKDEDGWQARNIVVDGINVGMMFRNQFEALVRRTGSIDAAIAAWREAARFRAG